MKKHILCLGDSNTHGYCADPADCADGGARFNEEERWTCLLQRALGEDYLITEDGLSGRTTVFDDPAYEGMAALPYLYPFLKAHEPVDLLIVMLGTNDTKERLGADAHAIALGMKRLVRAAQAVDCWAPGARPSLLLVAPPPTARGSSPPRWPRRWGPGRWRSPGGWPPAMRRWPGKPAVTSWTPALWGVPSTGWTSCT